MVNAKWHVNSPMFPPLVEDNIVISDIRHLHRWQWTRRFEPSPVYVNTIPVTRFPVPHPLPFPSPAHSHPS
jgi:hypothetical protein